MIRIVIASDAPKEGKSNCAVAVAHALEQLGATVNLDDDVTLFGIAARMNAIQAGERILEGKLVEVTTNPTQG